ncbi:MAG: hypothetical protein KAT78_03315 [Flavobacteriaceae bacterium]|nr:hypothetical protein [Flavobacteriaceae bacterium]
MKTILRIVFVIILILVGFGFYTNFNNEGEGEKFIGIGVLMFAFILMPLFIYHRYKGRDLTQYSLDNMLNEIEKNKEKKRK